MLSRVAERIYWMARYLERTENTARLINVHTALLLDMPQKMEFDWFTLIRIFNNESLFQELHDDMNENNIMVFMVTDSNNPNSILSSLSNIRENTRTSLDLLPEEIWESINQAYLLLQDELHAVTNRHHRQLLLQKLMHHCVCIRGILDSFMSRNHTFDFAQLGKHVERADMTSRILEMTSLLLSEARSEAVRQYEGILWTNLLQALNAHQMYLQHMHPPVTATSVLKFLVQDEAFPRSLYYSLHDIGYYLKHLSGADKSLRVQAQILKHLSDQSFETVPEASIHHLMDYLQQQLAALHDEISNTWFYPDNLS